MRARCKSGVQLQRQPLAALQKPDGQSSILTLMTRELLRRLWMLRRVDGNSEAGHEEEALRRLRRLWPKSRRL